MKSISRPKYRILLVAVAFSLFNLSPVNSAETVLYDQILTPEFLHANAEFPTRVPTLAPDKSYLEFGPGAADYTVILQLPLPVDGNRLPLDKMSVISITLNEEQISTDDDLRFGVSDGKQLALALKTDVANDRGSVMAGNGPASLDEPFNWQTLHTDVGYLASLRVDFIFVPQRPLTPDILFNVTGNPRRFTVNHSIDANGPLSLILLSGEQPERYRVKSIAVRVVTRDYLADSIAEFSDTQGKDNWYYGYFDLQNDEDGLYNYATDFKQLPNYFEGYWFILTGAGGYWTSIYDSYVIPNGPLSPAGDRKSHEHWAIRRWVSDFNGVVSIVGKLSKRWGIAGGDGAIAKILVDGVEVLNRNLSGDWTFGWGDLQIETRVKVGSVIDFVLAPYLNVNSDQVEFNATILPVHADPPLAIYRAVEVAFPTVTGTDYYLEYSLDLQNWTRLGAGEDGQGGQAPFRGNGLEQSVAFPTRDRQGVFYRLVQP